MGIRHDELLDGTGKAGLTFMFDAGIAERNAAAEPPSAGWADCELREWLNGDGLKLLPNELRALIKGVKKVSNNVGAANSASCLSELPATLWLPAMVELCGTQPPDSFTEGYHYLADIYNGEGREYQLFRRAQGEPVFHERDDGPPVEGQGHLLVGAHGEPRHIGERRHALYEPRGARRRRLYVRNACGKAKQANLCDPRVLYLGGGRLAVTGPLPGNCLDL